MARHIIPVEISWQKISEQSARIGFRRVLRRVYRLPDGREERFDIKDEGESVCILALTPEGGVVLTRQYRPGPGLIIDDLPGGAIDDGETPLEAARRELLEETGYEGELRSIGTCLECGYSTKLRHNFIAMNCVKIATPSPDENEFIETVISPLAEFRTHLRSGQLTVVETGYLGLDALGLL